MSYKLYKRSRYKRYSRFNRRNTHHSGYLLYRGYQIQMNNLNYFADNKDRTSFKRYVNKFRNPRAVFNAWLFQRKDYERKRDLNIIPDNDYY